MIRTQIQLPEDLYQELRRIASEQQRSIADCIREGVRMFLGRAREKNNDIMGVAGKFKPLPLDDLKPHDRWIAKAAERPHHDYGKEDEEEDR
ncbi:MAG: ribbon-helix-helix protein, CopG family [Pseudomonadota bacterium]